MDNIIITKGHISIELPSTDDLTVGAEEQSQEITMASGKRVKEMKGVRTTVKAKWSWLPQQTIVDLQDLLRQGGYFQVTYPDPSLGEMTQSFSIAFPSAKLFKFDDVTGEPTWYDITLTMEAQEVQ